MNYNIRDMFDGIKALELDIDEREYVSAQRIKALCSRKIKPDRKRYGVRKLFTIAFAAALIMTMSLTAYSISSIHQKRQQELREQYRLDKHSVESYVEYPETTQENGVVLLSAISDDRFMRIHLNVSPVTQQEAVTAIENQSFFCTLGADCPMLTANVPISSEEMAQIEMIEVYDENLERYISMPDKEKVIALKLEKAYDRETQTLTLTCSVDREELPEKEIELTVFSADTGNGYVSRNRIYGTVSFEASEVQSREIILTNPIEFVNPELEEKGFILGFTIYPISAKIYYEIEDFENIFSNGYDFTSEQYRRLSQWLNPLDDVIRECTLIFSDGTELSLAGGDNLEYENAVASERINWDSTVDINDIAAMEILGRRIELR